MEHEPDTSTLPMQPYHPHRGPVVRFFTWVILIGFALSLIAMAVALVFTMVRGR